MDPSAFLEKSVHLLPRLTWTNIYFCACVCNVYVRFFYLSKSSNFLRYICEAARITNCKYCTCGLLILELFENTYIGKVYFVIDNQAIRIWICLSVIVSLKNSSLLYPEKNTWLFTTWNFSEKQRKHNRNLIRDVLLYFLIWPTKS